MCKRVKSVYVLENVLLCLSGFVVGCVGFPHMVLFSCFLTQGQEVLPLIPML